MRIAFNGKEVKVIHVHRREGCQDIFTFLHESGWEMKYEMKFGIYNDTYPKEVTSKYIGQRCYRAGMNAVKVLKAPKKKLRI